MNSGIQFEIGFNMRRENYYERRNKYIQYILLKITIG